jgi:DNA modification methylase
MTSASSSRGALLHAQQEQLWLFPVHDAPQSSPNVSVCTQQAPSKRDRLATLLQSELNFHGENGNYASHHFHAFAARFPPQLPRVFARELTAPGDVVLDPMMGSGTTVVEALLEGRRGVGLDLDPLALRLCQAKTMPLQTDRLQEAAHRVVSQAYALARDKAIEQHLTQRFDIRTKAFVDYWFRPTTQRELMALVLAIESVTDASIRRFLTLTFSSIIITKSGGVTRARDLAHSRPHLDRAKVPKNALEQFALRLQKNLNSIAKLAPHNTMAAPLAGDARSMPFVDDVIDLIVTSPPYANALDYMRAHKFSLVWLGKSVTSLSALRAEYIGSERIKGTQCVTLPERPEGIMLQVAQRDKHKSQMLRKYFTEMKAVLAEMYRVLRGNAAAIVVVGPSVIRGINVETHQCLADIATELGFDVVGVVQRMLDRNKRMMPARFGQKTNAMIEQRMHEEYVIGLLKPSKTEQSVS